MLFIQTISPTGTDCKFAAYGLRVCSLRKNNKPAFPVRYLVVQHSAYVRSDDI